MAYSPVRSAMLAGAGAMGVTVPAPAWAADDERELAEDVVRRAEQRLRGSGVSVTAATRLGDPADAVLAVADELDADLVVVGNRGMTGVRRYLLGSVAGRVAHHARCSVHIAHTC
jgi:nucleotide-binding universal stress UspA family protein